MLGLFYERMLWILARCTSTAQCVCVVMTVKGKSGADVRRWDLCWLHQGTVDHNK